MSLGQSILWIELALLALLLISAPFSLWRDFNALMNLKRMLGTGVQLSPIARVLAGYLLARGYLLDALVNTVHLTVAMWEWPRELTVSDRVGRLKYTGTPRQRAIAEWFCGRSGLHLDDGDPSGCHCRL